MGGTENKVDRRHCSARTVLTTAAPIHLLHRMHRAFMIEDPPCRPNPSHVVPCRPMSSHVPWLQPVGMFTLASIRPLKLIYRKSGPCPSGNYTALRERVDGKL